MINKLLQKLIGKNIKIELDRKDPENKICFLMAKNIKLKIKMSGEIVRIHGPCNSSLHADTIRYSESVDQSGFQNLDIVLVGQDFDDVIYISAFGHSQNLIKITEIKNEK